MAKNEITLTQRSVDGKLSMAFVNNVNKAYTKVSLQLHEAACLTFFRAAQFGDCDGLNKFYSNLRVNDQTALRVWFGKHATYLDLEKGAMSAWIKWNKEKGFSIVKGTESRRKDIFSLEGDEDGKQPLLSLKPFYDKDVTSKDAITLEALFAMLQKTADSIQSKAKKENINLPADMLNLTSSMKNYASKELEAIERIKAQAE